MKPVVKIDANGSGDRTIIRFGRVAREDPDTEVHIYQYDNVEKPPRRVFRHLVDGAKSWRPEVEVGGKYAVVVIGDKTAGVVSTAPKILTAPFNVFLDPPEDHSRDYLKISIPTDVPIEGDLKRSIKAALSQK